MSFRPVGIETLAVHAGRSIDPATGALSEPIHLSTSFERPRGGGYAREFSYSRDDNPNRRALESCLAKLEGGKYALAFPSGLAALSALLHGLAPGDHILAPKDVYHGFIKVVDEVFRHSGIEISYADMGDSAATESALRPSTKFIWIETPSNPLLKVVDLQTLAHVAKNAGILTICDGTLSTPVLQRPLEYGIDMVLHSSTKLISGHGDVTGGVLVTAEENLLFDAARTAQKVGGMVPSPFDCWLTLRGIETLPLRARAQSAAAFEIARWLRHHRVVEKVLYPGLPGQPGHESACRQMSFFGNIVSLLVRGSASEAVRVAGATEIFTRATSIGSTHSLIEHRASVEGPRSAAPENLLRLSIGLESVEDLVADLSQALSQVGL